MAFPISYLKKLSKISNMRHFLRTNLLNFFRSGELRIRTVIIIFLLFRFVHQPKLEISYYYTIFLKRAAERQKQWLDDTATLSTELPQNSTQNSVSKETLEINISSHQYFPCLGRQPDKGISAFKRDNRCIKNIPPTEAAFKEHILRAIYTH